MESRTTSLEDGKQDNGEKVRKKERRRWHTLFDIRYYIMQSHLLHALMLLIPMVLPILGLGGHVEISVPAIRSCTCFRPLSFSIYPLLFNSLRRPDSALAASLYRWIKLWAESRRTSTWPIVSDRPLAVLFLAANKRIKVVVSWFLIGSLNDCVYWASFIVWSWSIPVQMQVPSGGM